MGEVVHSVEKAYLTSLEELRRICKDASRGNRQYSIVRCDDKEVMISYSDGSSHWDNSQSFAFPTLPFIWPYGLPASGRRLARPGLMVCLHVLIGRRAVSQNRREAKGRKEAIADWEKFWPGLETELIKRLDSRSRQVHLTF